MMTDIAAFLIAHGYAVIFLFVTIEHLGVPLPAIPLLLAAGALVDTGALGFVPALLAAVAAAVLADGVLYVIGRRHGMGALQTLCRISLEPDSCVRRTEQVFAKHGAASLLAAKVLPGVKTAAPPLAGVFRMSVGRFLAYDTAGAVLWAAAFLGLGWAFGEELERVAAAASRLGGWLAVVLAACAAGYVAWKYAQRQRFLRNLRIDRISPEELARLLESGEDVVVVDLRHRVEFEADPVTIPGALHVPEEQLRVRAGELPRTGEVVLYCT